MQAYSIHENPIVNFKEFSRQGERMKFPKVLFAGIALTFRSKLADKFSLGTKQLYTMIIPV